MKRPWMLLVLALLLFVVSGNTPVYAEEVREPILINAVQGNAVFVKDKKVFQENFTKTIQQFVTKATPSTMQFDKPHSYYCSGFVQDLYRLNGIWIPAHSIVQQAKFGIKFENLNKVEPGDLVFFSGSRLSKVPAHVAVAIGNGRFLHASGPNHQIQVLAVNKEMQNHFLFAARLISTV